MTDLSIAPAELAIAAIKNGEFVVVVDDENRENEGGLVIAAEFCTAEKINFMVTQARGLVCIAMSNTMLDRLQIPLMVPSDENSSGDGAAFTLSVQATNNITTGISAAGRAQTIKTLISPVSSSTDIATPGHMFPLRAVDGGVLERRGQTEASVDLAKLASLKPAGVICEIMDEVGETMRLPELCEFAAMHNILIISVDAIAKYRQEHEAESTQINAKNEININLIGKSKLPTEHGIFDITVFRDQQGQEHSLLSMGDLSNATPLVRLHSECLTGDAFGSLRCDCGEQLQFALSRIAQDGCGAVIYLRQEGRGIGLGNKIRAYELQDGGMDTVDANHQLGFPADARVYDTAAHILESVNATSVRLMTNNPDKISGLESLGITVAEQIPHEVEAHEHNASYLKTKARRMGHMLRS